MSSLVTADRLRELLSYDAETGVFVWLVDKSNRVRAGMKLGVRRGDGYVVCKVDGRRYYVHRLAWFYVHGQWPCDTIDHINGNPSDNRIANLRDVTRSVNAQNLQRAPRSNKASGLLGVGAKGNRWQAHIKVGGKAKHLGMFAASEDAHAAYVEAKRRLHPGCQL